MTTRFQLSPSCNLSHRLEIIAKNDDSTAEEVIRKVVWLYISTKDAKYDGFELGLFDPRSGSLVTKAVNANHRHAP